MSKKKKEVKEETKEQIHPEENNVEEIELLGNRIKDLEEKLVRNQADLINYKRRKEEETSRLLKYANEDIIKDLLPVMDNFERAIESASSNDDTKSVLEGIKMIYNSMVNILNKIEVKEITSQDQEFDPTYHQAVLTGKDESKKSGIILEVLQKGYMYKDRVIRPSMVKVNE